MNPFATILVCEKCGAVLSNQKGFFGCSNRCRGLCDGVGYIKATKLDEIVLNTLSDIMIPDIEFSFDEPDSTQDTNAEYESKIILTQIQKHEIRLERVKSAYEEGVDSIEEYKANKKAILNEIDKLKEMLETTQENEPEEDVEIDKKELRRLIDIFKDEKVNNVEKNRVARAVFKEITKGGNGGKRLKFVFWNE